MERFKHSLVEAAKLLLYLDLECKKQKTSINTEALVKKILVAIFKEHLCYV